ncbi:MAG: membrane protein insertase YidC [Cytophagales bacterium]|nr:membrane protein insertase YidC [Bernardetiaceae bacterium]MDW8203405.1 membrane protein insertase YidC [Cytophagales bacterium]
MDRNSIIGIVLISIMLLTYLTFFSEGPQAPKQAAADSTQAVQQATPQPELLKPANPEAEAMALPDSIFNRKYGIFAPVMKGEAQDVVLENPDVRITFTTKGGRIKQVLLKNYVTYQKTPLILIDELSSRTTAKMTTTLGEIDAHQLYYAIAQKNDNQVVFRAYLDSIRYIEQRYTLPPEGFVVSWRLNADALGNLLANRLVRFDWTDRLKQQEKDIEQIRATATVNYYQVNSGMEKLSETANEPQEERATEPVRWIALKQKFFNTALITNASFSEVVVRSNPPTMPTKEVKQLSMQVSIPLDDLKDDSKDIRFFYGPNDFRIAEKVAPGFEENVYLGWAIFSTVNRYIIMPLFELLEKVSDNYGIVILLLVLIVKTALFPLVYRSYQSMAKMRVLKPELDQLKAQYGDDMQRFQQEQMKLYSQFGVNPLSGCIPVLLQLPVLLAMFNFFPNAIQLRQKTFLWADDLSSYDSILDLPFHIPFYGDHVSLFTILMTLSTIAYTYYNNQLSPNIDPNMKIVSYLMPIIFVFVLNSFSAGLTYYYFISNIITIIQQLSIRSFVDEAKIRAKLEENRKRFNDPNRKKSGFQQRLEEALKAQEEARKNKNKKK